MDLNKVMIIGRLTADPEARTTPQGITVVNFSIATNRIWKDQQGNQQERVEYHNVVAWRRLAEICAQYLAKGRQVYLEGYLQTRSWEDNDGKKNYRTEIVADNMIMLGSRADNPTPATTTSTTQTTPSPATSVATAKPDTPTAKQEETPAPATVSDEEIRIEDIPF
jgi:single-strand DNA-binding protein